MKKEGSVASDRNPTKSPIEVDMAKLFANHDKTLLDLDPAEANVYVTRYLKIGDFTTAEYWADRKFALAASRNISAWTRYADLLQDLASCKKHLRIVAICERYNLHVQHLFYMHFYITAIIEKKNWHEVVVVPCAQFFRDGPVTFDPCVVPLVESSNSMTTDPEFEPLDDDERAKMDEVVDEFGMRASVLLNLGKAFLFCENREAASACIQAAYRLDKSNLQAENMLTQYSLLPTDESVYFGKYREMRRDANAEATDKDPREMVLRAQEYYEDGDTQTANMITSKIIDNYGLYQDALLLHIATLAQLQESDRLFLLAHRLVDAQPDSEVSWYAVSLYYMVCRNMQAAKSFMNKATTINEYFGEGWLAFGHILALDCEQDQAMNCYLRAARVLEKNFEPLLYVAMGHCSANNLGLAHDFLRDAEILGKQSPIVLHEKGSLAYTQKKYHHARELYMDALRILTKTIDDKSGTQLLELLDKPLDTFWEALVNNLGHANRKLGSFHEAIRCHQKALLMVPRKLSTIMSLGICYACMEKPDMASQYFHQALMLKPFNSVARSALEGLVGENHESGNRALQGRDVSYSLEELRTELFSPRDPIMDKMSVLVCENHRRDFFPRQRPDLMCHCSECRSYSPSHGGNSSRKKRDHI